MDREPALRRILASLREQSLTPDLIVIAAPERSLLPADILDDPRLLVVDGVRGASAQRNLAVSALPTDLDLVFFFDDDAVPRADYIERMTSVFEDRSIVGATGLVARDGAAEKRELTPAEIGTALEASWSSTAGVVTDLRGLYGSNMVVRAEAVRVTPFDERLPLYSWLEDLDFSRRLLPKGRLVHVPAAVCVHQGSESGGRREHRRLGYSQVANVEYLRRKGSIDIRDVVRLMGRPLAATLVGAVRGDAKKERRQRLAGMGMAFGDIARGRVTPERIEQM